MTRLLTFARRQPTEIKRFIKFLFVGASGFLVDFGGFNLFHWLGVGSALTATVLPSPYLVANPEIIEQTLSFSCAVVNNFIWNYFWIYPEAKGTNQTKKLIKFFIVSVAGLVIGIPVYTAAIAVTRPLVAAMGLSGLQFNLAGNLALVCRVAVLLFWNFFVNRYWTYRDV